MLPPPADEKCAIKHPCGAARLPPPSSPCTSPACPWPYTSASSNDCDCHCHCDCGGDCDSNCKPSSRRQRPQTTTTTTTNNLPSFPGRLPRFASASSHPASLENQNRFCSTRDGQIMTSRPSVGRQGPQRSLSSTNALQRPPPHRTLSQQFSSSSPTRRGNEGFVDLTFDESVLARHGPRVGTSRLRVEISKDSGPSEMVESPKPISDAAPTWRPSLPPRGRPQLHFDVPSISNLSPHPAQDGGQNEVTIKPMPLPVRPGQHAPPSSEKSRAAPSNAAKKDARPKPYILEVPTAAPHYSPNGS